MSDLWYGTCSRGDESEKFRPGSATENDSFCGRFGQRFHFHSNSGLHHQEIYLQGKVQIDETRTSSISTNFSGRIDQLMVAFTGETVKKGDSLATIYSPDLVTAQRELMEAKKTKVDHPKLYRAARKKLMQWKPRPAQIDLLEESTEVNKSFDILADVAGVVSKKNITERDFMNRGSILFESSIYTRPGSSWMYMKTNLPQYIGMTGFILKPTLTPATNFPERSTSSAPFWMPRAKR